MAPRPICFMVMPYRTKEVPGPPRPGVPPSVDCDALWERAFQPALEALGYQAIRGDYDPSSVILKEMIERLAWADLVLADVTLPNGNVYYEVGLRHVARDTNCVLVAAEWSQPLFDISQFSAVRFPLSQSRIGDEEARVTRELLQMRIPALRETRTPYHELLATGDDGRRRGVFREQVERIDAFQTGVREIRLETDPARRRARIIALRDGTLGAALQLPEVAVELLTLIRDGLAWDEVVHFIATLPTATARLPFVEEQRLLALSHVGNATDAVAGLERLIATQGDTPERRGLLGGRFKRLWRAARAGREATEPARPSLEERRHLAKAIEHYEAGMALDLNGYYCSSNLPSLLRARDEPGDERRAQFVNALVIEQCSRARHHADHDEWLRPTLLAASLRSGSLEEVRRLTDRIALEGVDSWKLRTILDDLTEDARQLPEGAIREAARAAGEELARLL